MVEQISILEINRKINSGTLLKYLPKEKSNLPALSNIKNNKHSKVIIVDKVGI